MVWGRQLDKEALFNVAFNVTDNISSRHNNYIFNSYLPALLRYSYIPEGTFLPRKEGSFRGRKIFVRKEAFK